MPTDLTERLAAKLGADAGLGGPYCDGFARDIAGDAAILLPLLLSEPELVASLPDEVRLSVLTPRERAVMKLGEAECERIRTANAWIANSCRETADADDAAGEAYDLALADVLALTPEGKDG